MVIVERYTAILALRTMPETWKQARQPERYRLPNGNYPTVWVRWDPMKIWNKILDFRDQKFSQGKNENPGGVQI